MVSEPRQFIVLKARVLNPPAIGATRYMVKQAVLGGPQHGESSFRVQVQIPQTIEGKVPTVRGPLGNEGGNGFWAVGRHRLVADDGEYLTFDRVE